MLCCHGSIPGGWSTIRKVGGQFGVKAHEKVASQMMGRPWPSKFYEFEYGGQKTFIWFLYGLWLRTMDCWKCVGGKLRIVCWKAQNQTILRLHKNWQHENWPSDTSGPFRTQFSLFQYICWAKLGRRRSIGWNSISRWSAPPVESLPLCLGVQWSESFGVHFEVGPFWIVLESVFVRHVLIK